MLQSMKLQRVGHDLATTAATNELRAVRGSGGPTSIIALLGFLGGRGVC